MSIFIVFPPYITSNVHAVEGFYNHWPTESPSRRLLGILTHTHIPTTVRFPRHNHTFCLSNVSGSYGPLQMATVTALPNTVVIAVGKQMSMSTVNVVRPSGADMFRVGWQEDGETPWWGLEFRGTLWRQLKRKIYRQHVPSFEHHVLLISWTT